MYCAVWRFSVCEYSTVRRLFRRIIPNHQLLPTILIRTVMLLPNHWELIDTSSSALPWPSNIGYFFTFRFLLVPAHPCRCYTALVFFIRRKSSNEEFGDGLGHHDRIFRCCISVLAYDISNIIPLAYMTHKAIDRIFVRHGEFLWSSLLSTFVKFVLSFFAWFVRCVYKLSLGKLG